MPPVLTKEDLLFLKQAEGMSLFFDKIGAAKQLIAEAKGEMHAFVRVLGKQKKKPKTKSHKVLRAPRAKPLEFGVDMPDTLSDTERKVYAELQKAGAAGMRPRDLATALKIATAQIGRATRALKKRKLITSTGATLNLTWKVR